MVYALKIAVQISAVYYMRQCSRFSTDFPLYLCLCLFELFKLFRPLRVAASF